MAGIKFIRGGVGPEPKGVTALWQNVGQRSFRPYPNPAPERAETGKGQQPGSLSQAWPAWHRLRLCSLCSEQPCVSLQLQYEPRPHGGPTHQKAPRAPLCPSQPGQMRWCGPPRCSHSKSQKTKRARINLSSRRAVVKAMGRGCLLGLPLIARVAPVSSRAGTGQRKREICSGFRKLWFYQELARGPRTDHISEHKSIRFFPL